MIYKVEILLLALPTMVRAMVWTNYMINPPQANTGLFECGLLFDDVAYCGARVNNTVCEPLTSDWCGSMNMSGSYTYLTKENVVEQPEPYKMTGYHRTVPICVQEGSEFELKFMFYKGWTEAAVDLLDGLDNIVLHTMMRPVDFYFTTMNATIWQQDEGHHGNFSFKTGTEYILRIVCDTNTFKIYLDGTLEWTYTYRLPVTSIRKFNTYYAGAAGDLYKVTYKA